jgi:hypothetical protein
MKRDPDLIFNFDPCVDHAQQVRATLLAVLLKRTSTPIGHSAQAAARSRVSNLMHLLARPARVLTAVTGLARQSSPTGQV